MVRYENVPYYGTYNRLHVPVWATSFTVIRAARGKLSAEGKSRAQREARHNFLRCMLMHHDNALDLYVQVVHGDVD